MAKARVHEAATGSSSNPPRVYRPGPTDRLTPAFDAVGLIPKEFKGSDDFLDIVTWNIRYFHDRDRARVNRVVEILNVLNADVIVLQEILDGSLGVVAQGLADKGAGNYKIAYGTTGGDQRVALMYDLDWIRAKDDFRELFGKRQVVTPEGKDAFWRLPLYAYFTALSHVTPDPFDFQFVGLHLKSQRGGGEEQRRVAAQRLSTWLTAEAEQVDADVILMGDWNASPDAKAWQPLHELENGGRVRFHGINTSSDISHLYYRNKRSIGSRLDLAMISIAADHAMKDQPRVVRWKSLDDLLATQPKGKQIKKYIEEVSGKISDHMPVVTRFFFAPPN